MLIYSMSVWMDGFLADREGAFGRSARSEELFRLQLTKTRKLGGFLGGRRLSETMLVWETDPSTRSTSASRRTGSAWSGSSLAVDGRVERVRAAVPGREPRAAGRRPRRQLRDWHR